MLTHNSSLCQWSSHIHPCPPPPHPPTPSYTLQLATEGMLHTGMVVWDGSKHLARLLASGAFPWIKPGVCGALLAAFAGLVCGTLLLHPADCVNVCGGYVCAWTGATDRGVAPHPVAGTCVLEVGAGVTGLPSQASHTP